jgi:hypothetical protein
MLPVRQRSGIKTRKHALGPGAALTALLLTASCTPAPDDGNGGVTGSGGTSSSSGGNSGSGGKPAGNGGSGGTNSTGSGGTSSTGSGGTSSTGSGGTSSTGSGGTSSTGSGGTTGTADGGGGSDAPTVPPPVGDGVLPTCTGDAAGTPPTLKKTLVARIPGGDQAGQVVGVPGEKGIYILGHRTGKVFYSVDGKLDPTPMASVAVKNNPGQDEQGLLGMALHPQFKENQLFYLLYTAANSNIHIEELKRMSPTTSMVSKTIWDKARTGGGAFHNGGQIWFNPKDGADKPILYHSVGNNSNKATSGMAEGVSGRVLGHDLSGGMVNSKTVSYGLRNPYRMTIDRGTGDMYIGEIDDPPGGAIYFQTNGTAGKNYGYSGASNGVAGGLTGKEGNKAIIGGIVYRGTKITGLCGRYFYASWPDGAIKSLVVKDGKLVGAATAHGGLGSGGIASFGEDGEGEIYYSTQMGEVYKIEM